MLRIHNFRAGFATNSSSSHSVVLLAPPDIGRVSQIEADSEDHYGWDNFRLTTQEQKLRYLAGLLFGSYIENKEAVSDIVEQIRDVEPNLGASLDAALAQQDAISEDEDWAGSDECVPTVDHQSTMSFPTTYDPSLTAVLLQFFQSPRVAVIGGNDNGDCGEGVTPAGAEPVEFLGNMTGRHIVARKEGSYWTIFDPSAGNKMRFSFDRDDLDASDYVKSLTPELVDLKITDWCSKGCAFCYQSSTTAGAHASYARIEAILDMLADMQVFEVAIGGGEPTSHPDFARILEAAYDRKIIANFTTFSDEWCNDSRLLEMIRTTVGGIGVSCMSVKDLGRVQSIMDYLNGLRGTGRSYRSNPTVMVQHVFGSVPMYVTAELLDAAFAAGYPVLLLGYKEVGFGATFERHDDHNAETFIRLAVDQSPRPVTLSIDTALVDQYPKLPGLLGAPKALVTSPEGKFSCYIDAVENRVGPSSYGSEDAMQPMVDSVEAFKAVFAQF